MRTNYNQIIIYCFICFLSILFSKTDIAKSSFYDLWSNTITGEILSFDNYQGKMILIVNVASKCGYTYQYEGLQKLYEQYGGFIEILGFPSNNFLWQEPGNNNEIKTFCKLNYGVTFPMFEKINVKAPHTHLVYQWLSDSTLNGWNSELPSWNFCKYLINDKGKLIKYYGPNIEPMDTAITKHIEIFKKNKLSVN
tara:strand:- start:167 stop:751 length:585 start_codon:yes stop_codon:yes gene_type:complete